MDYLNFLLSWTPVLLITVLAVGLRRQALDLAVWGTLYTIGLVVLHFNTSPGVVFLAGVDGILTNLPLLLVIYAGMLLSGLLLETGSLERVVGWFSSLARDRNHSTILIAVGSGNFMEGAGIVAEPIIAPMLKAHGLPPAGCAALSIAGYAGLMILEFGGAFLAVLALVTGLDTKVLGAATAILSLPATLVMVLYIPWLLGRGSEFSSQFVLLAGSALLAAGGALLAVHYIEPSISGLFGGLVVIAALTLPGRRRLMNLDARLVRDMAPLLLLIACLFAVNLIAPLKEAAIGMWPANLSIIPGHEISFRPLASTYTYIFLSYLLAVLMVRRETPPWRNFKATNRRAWKPMLAMALFGVTGQIIAYSGFEPGFASVNPANSIAFTMADGAVKLSGSFYPFFAPLIGWAGTFLTGYGAASIVLFGKLQVATANMLDVSPAWLSSGLAVGSAVGSISSPLKIALAAPLCGAQGMEGEILRRTIPLGIGAAFVLGAFLLLVM